MSEGYKKFEYLHVVARGFGTTDQHLNDLGSIGWELVCQDQAGLRFKREIGVSNQADMDAFNEKYGKAIS